MTYPQRHQVNSPANAVRVWRGYKSNSLSQEKFLSDLGSVFIPATVKMQIDAYLHSYTPTVPGGMPGKPATVPDETAILFWRDQATYTQGFERLACRTYTLTHGGVYQTSGSGPKSGANFPNFYTGPASLTFEQPVNLFDNATDWMHLPIHHLVAARPKRQRKTTWHSRVATALSQIQAAGGLEGAIACIGEDYLVYWELGRNGAGAKSGIPALEAICTGWKHLFRPAPTSIPEGLYDIWPGMTVVSGSSFNMEFIRNTNY